jgi:hypothetical protein
MSKLSRAFETGFDKFFDGFDWLVDKYTDFEERHPRAVVRTLVIGGTALALAADALAVAPDSTVKLYNKAERSIESVVGTGWDRLSQWADDSADMAGRWVCAHADLQVCPPSPEDIIPVDRSPIYDQPNPDMTRPIQDQITA